MENIRKIVVIFLLLILSQASAAQAHFFNQTDYNLSFIYEGQKQTILANDFIIWSDAPEGEFVVYAYRQTADNSVLIIEKLGFLTLKNEKNLIVFNQEVTPLPAYLFNIGQQELIIEYANLAIFLLPGESVLLKSIFINSEARASVIKSYFLDDRSSGPEAIILEFKLENGCLSTYLK